MNVQYVLRNFHSFLNQLSTIVSFVGKLFVIHIQRNKEEILKISKTMKEYVILVFFDILTKFYKISIKVK